MGVIFAPLLFLIACVATVNPVIPESGATFDARLIGTWEEVGGHDSAIVTRGVGNKYAIEWHVDGETKKVEGRLGRLGGQLILDAWASPVTGDRSGLAGAQLTPEHVIFSIELDSNEVRIRTLEFDSVLAALKAGQLKLRHADSANQIILQGTTEELRAALVPYFAKTNMFGEVDKWRRAGTGPAPTLPVEPPCFQSAAWREADQLFHRDPHWLGGDAASSVDLGNGRILWLFGDSWVNPSGTTRQGARMVSNTVAIQTGADPSTASIRFYWGLNSAGSPAPFISDAGAERHWFGTGVRLGDRLVLFLNRIGSSNAGLGFESVGTVAWMVENPDSEPPAWRIRKVAMPSNPLGVLTGFAAVQQLSGYVYAFGSADPIKSHPIYAARWPVEQVRNGDLLAPEWWGGERQGWVPDSTRAPRWPLFENGQSELSIHLDSVTKLFLGIQTQGFGSADVMIRAAAGLTTQWTPTKTLYRPPEYSRPNVMIYSAKAHPHLGGGDLVLTYSTNTFKFTEQLTDSLIYYPRFVRLTRCK